MPLMQLKPPIDPASAASKLPGPLQKPAGTALGGLQSIFGGDDPISSMMGAAAPMTSISGGIGQGLNRIGQAGSEAVQGLKGIANRGIQGAKNMLGMGASSAAGSQMPSASYRGMMGDDLHLYDISGGPSHGSTVSGDTLRQMGIPVPGHGPGAVQGLAAAGPINQAPKGGAKLYDPEAHYQDYLKQMAAGENDAAAAVRGTPADIPDNPAAQQLERLRTGDRGLSALDAHQNQTYADIMKQANPARTTPNLANRSVKDLMNPQAVGTMDKMFQEANPVFKQMQAKGMFNRGQ